MAEAVDVASDKTMDYGSIALSKADEATSVAARATASKVAEVWSALYQHIEDTWASCEMRWKQFSIGAPALQASKEPCAAGCIRMCCVVFW